MASTPRLLTRHWRASAAHRNYPRQFGGGIRRILRVLRRKQWVEDFRYVVLEFERGGRASRLSLTSSPFILLPLPRLPQVLPPYVGGPDPYPDVGLSRDHRPGALRDLPGDTQ